MKFWILFIYILFLPTIFAILAEQLPIKYFIISAIIFTIPAFAGFIWLSYQIAQSTEGTKGDEDAR